MLPANVGIGHDLLRPFYFSQIILPIGTDNVVATVISKRTECNSGAVRTSQETLPLHDRDILTLCRQNAEMYEYTTKTVGTYSYRYVLKRVLVSWQLLRRLLRKRRQCNASN